MILESWLPIGYPLPDSARTRRAVFEGKDWQIVESEGGGRALIVNRSLHDWWIHQGFLEPGEMGLFHFGDRELASISSGSSQFLTPVVGSRSPNNKAEAMAFAVALRQTRERDQSVPLQDSVYVEKLCRLLPTQDISSRVEDDVVLGFWLTGGARVSAKSFRRLRQMMSWIGAEHLKEVVETAGIGVSEVIPQDTTKKVIAQEAGPEAPPTGEKAVETLIGKERFSLPGRPELENFFNEHVVDIVRNRERYKALGIGFPSAVVLHGPPGCGKTYAVEKLVEFLGWPSFEVSASSVASPYIHETSRKVAEVFGSAIQQAPSVLVIDEMEAFLAERDSAMGGHHRVEEVAEFLRRIPEAVSHEVLVIAMTNKIEMIDSAILRRGRFDNLLKIDYASEEEVLQLLEKLLSELPIEGTIDLKSLAGKLSGRPLSDVAFVVREAARLAARAGATRISWDNLQSALSATPSRTSEGTGNRIGFV